MDEDLLRRKKILNIILVGSIAMLVMLDTFVLFYSLHDGSSYMGIPFELFSLLPAFFILLYALSRRGFFDLASYSLVGAYLASNSYTAYRWGAAMPIALIAYALIIVIATILRGTKFGFFVTGLIAAIIVPLWYIQLHGIATIEKQRVHVTDAITFSILYFLIMTVAWLYDREIERSLRRARDSELILKKERDMLEVTVAERTEEIRRSQFEKVQQLTRFAELGQLSAGLFHDLINLLNALSLRADDGADPSIASVFSTTKQIEGFVQAVRKQIRGTGERESFSLTQGIEHVIQLVKYQAQKERVGILFRNNHHEDIIQYDAPFKFQEIVINLLLNAIESYENIPNGDTRTRTIEISLEKWSDMATLRVVDNGCGMTPEIRARIFEPFFTTKETSKGIGIGLSTIKGIIEDGLSGTINVQSEPGKGSLFTIIFPIQHEPISNDDRPGDRTHQTPAIP